MRFSLVMSDFIEEKICLTNLKIIFKKKVTLYKIEYMENRQLQSKIDFTHNIANLPIAELEYYMQEINALILRKKTQDKEARDSFLLDKINKTVLDKKKTERYKALSYKLEAETITEAEYQEFMQLATLEEKLRNQRVKYLIELSKLRAISLPQLMITLGLKHNPNG